MLTGVDNVNSMPYGRNMETKVTPDMMADGHPHLFVAIATLPLDAGAHRWIGVCRTCKATRKLEGTIVAATGRGTTTFRDRAVLGTDGKIYTTRTIGEATAILIRCSSCPAHQIARYALVRLVVEGSKASKHTCGAKCTNATGPSCDCRCKGANHGSNH